MKLLSGGHVPHKFVIFQVYFEMNIGFALDETLDLFVRPALANRSQRE